MFLCYSINKRESFDNLQHWLNEIYDLCEPNILVFVVGCKQDLESEREVSRESALLLQREYDIKYWIETSAKSGENVETLYLDASRFIFNIML